MKSGYFFRGALLITAGVLLLLSNLGFVKANFWWQLFQLWPVLLIAFGLRLVGKDSWAMNMAVLALIGATIGYAVWISNAQADIGPKNTARFNQAFSQDIQEADLTVNFGDGNLTMGHGNIDLIRAALDYFREQPEFEYESVGARATMVITQEELRGSGINIPSGRWQTREWDISLLRGPLWRIKLNAGACKLDADLSSLTVETMQINAGASDIKVIFGKQSQDSNVIVKAGASNIQLSFPQDAGVKINMTGALSNHNFSEVSFVKIDDYYYSPGFESAEYFYLVEISVGVSNIMVLQY